MIKFKVYFKRKIIKVKGALHSLTLSAVRTARILVEGGNQPVRFAFPFLKSPAEKFREAEKRTGWFAAESARRRAVAV